MKTTYRDLAEFGLVFVTPEEADFARLAEEIRNRPSPFPRGVEGDLDAAAVLRNESGKAVITLSILWRYTTAEGRTTTNHSTNINSSQVISALLGYARILPENSSFILPGSKRLITETGVWGDNFDVAPPIEARGGGFGMAGGGRGHGRDSLNAVSREVQIDLAIFEDGICAGPDDFGLFPALVADLETRRKTAQEALSAMRAGASRGQLFEVFQPFARRRVMFAGHGRRPPLVLHMFADMAIRNLIDLEDSELAGWLEEAARPPARELRRA